MLLSQGSDAPTAVFEHEHLLKGVHMLLFMECCLGSDTPANKLCATCRWLCASGCAEQDCCFVVSLCVIYELIGLQLALNRMYEMISQPDGLEGHTEWPAGRDCVDCLLRRLAGDKEHNELICFMV